MLACPDMTVLCSSSLRRYKTPASCNSPAVSFPNRHHGSPPQTYASRRYLVDDVYFLCSVLFSIVVVVGVSVAVPVIMFSREGRTRNRKARQWERRKKKTIGTSNHHFQSSFSEIRGYLLFRNALDRWNTSFPPGRSPCTPSFSLNSTLT